VKNAQKQEGFVVIAPVLRHTRVKKANAKARLNLTCASKEIHHDDLESSAI
jgi:chemotaxis response regulator CheB